MSYNIMHNEYSCKNVSICFTGDDYSRNVWVTMPGISSK